MRGILVIEMDLADNFDIASAQLSAAVRAVGTVRTEQMTDDIIVGLNYAATKVLTYLKNVESAASEGER